MGKKCLEDNEAPDSLKVLADGELLVKTASWRDGEDARPVHARLLDGCEEDECHGDERWLVRSLDLGKAAWIFDWMVLAHLLLPEMLMDEDLPDLCGCLDLLQWMRLDT
ncbi:hypothetical protein ACLOJK_019134, partial [Asimina triloba]